MLGIEESPTRGGSSLKALIDKGFIFIQPALISPLLSVWENFCHSDRAVAASPIAQMSFSISVLAINFNHLDKNVVWSPKRRSDKSLSHSLPYPKVTKEG